MCLSALACFPVIHRVNHKQAGDLFFAAIKGLIPKNDMSPSGRLDNDNAHYASFCGRHHDRFVNGLWLASLHDKKRGPKKIPQSASLFSLAWQRALLGWT